MAGPPERRDARAQRAVRVAADERIDHESLEPGVPSAADLGGPRIDLGGRERDLTRVTQDGLAQLAFRAGRGQLVTVRLDHVDDDT